MNLRSVKTIVLSGIALLVATLPSLAQIPTHIPHPKCHNVSKEEDA
jgi:hypothetical protein